jgi:hypothetical protein
MLAYKFLLPGARGPFSGYAWPAPPAAGSGPWVAASGGPVVCRTAVHGCLVEHLPWWIQDELWLAEFAAPVTLVGHKLMAERARLVRRIDGWDPSTARDFAAACAGRARDRAVEALERSGAAAEAEALGVCADPQHLLEVAGALEVPAGARVSTAMAGDAAARALTGPTATAAYIAAHAALQIGGQAAMAAERAWQTAWLRERLDLRHGTGPVG